MFELNGVIFDNLPRSISQAELDAIASRYISRENVGVRYVKPPSGNAPIAVEYFETREKVSLRDLYEMLAEIDHLFDARHVLGRAVLPVQDIQGGIVHVQIIEGSFGKGPITVKGQQIIPELKRQELVTLQRPLEKLFINKYFRFEPGSVANVQKLEEEILRFNRTYRTQLIAELEPGGELGESDLKLTAIVPQPVSGGWYSDNSGRESSGEIRNGYFVQIQDVLGWNESFSKPHFPNWRYGNGSRSNRRAHDGRFGIFSKF